MIQDTTTAVTANSSIADEPQVSSVNRCSGLVINAPELFADPGFLEWLNNDTPKFTWHRRGQAANEWSDVVVLVDPSLNGEGADSDMPEFAWEQIVQACRQHFGSAAHLTHEHHIMVRLTNMVMA